LSGMHFVPVVFSPQVVVVKNPFWWM
jgi:hypothetical protein